MQIEKLSTANRRRRLRELDDERVAEAVKSCRKVAKIGRSDAELDGMYVRALLPHQRRLRGVMARGGVVEFDVWGELTEEAREQFEGARSRSREQGAGSREQGAGSREQGAGSRERGKGREERRAG